MRQRIDVDVVNPFLAAVVDVFSTMAQIQPDPGRPFLKQSSLARGDITGIIGITSKDKGTISLTLPSKLALQAVSNMTGEEYTDLNDEVRDAIGELTNMISGQARNGLAAIGRRYHAAIPTVTVGPQHVIQHISSGPILGMPFETEYGEITVEVCFDQCRG